MTAIPPVFDVLAKPPIADGRIGITCSLCLKQDHVDPAHLAIGHTCVRCGVFLSPPRRHRPSAVSA